MKLKKKIFWILDEQRTIAMIEQSMNDIAVALQDGTSDVAEIPEVKSPTELMFFSGQNHKSTVR